MVSTENVVSFAPLLTKDVYDETPVTIYGWGKTSGYSLAPSSVLQEKNLKTLLEERCKEELKVIGHAPNPNVLCASASDATSCEVIVSSSKIISSF